MNFARECKDAEILKGFGKGMQGSAPDFNDLARKCMANRRCAWFGCGTAWKVKDLLGLVMKSRGVEVVRIWSPTRVPFWV